MYLYFHKYIIIKNNIKVIIEQDRGMQNAEFKRVSLV